MLFAIAAFLTSCYTEVGYDYEREAYWNKVEKKNPVKENNDYNYPDSERVSDEAYDDSTEYYADENYEEGEYYDDTYADDYYPSRTRRFYDSYYPNTTIIVGSSYYDPWWNNYWPYSYYSYSWYNPWYYPSYSYWYPYRYNYYSGWYNWGYYGNNYSYNDYYFGKTKSRTNWNSRLRDNTGGRSYRTTDVDRPTRAGTTTRSSSALSKTRSERSDDRYAGMVAS